MGVITKVPKKVPLNLPAEPSGPHEWYYLNSSLWHDGSETDTSPFHLRDLKPHETVGIFLTTDGDLHIYHNGQHIKKMATHLPVGDSLWGAVDVWGRCTKIKSELLSGE